MSPVSTAMPDGSTLLGLLPSSLRKELLAAYGKIVKNFRERRWEPSELNGGKLCEIVYTILHGHVGGAFPAKSSKPTNMLASCQALEHAPSTFPRSVRIQIPRMLIALYEIRNNRGVGHAGADVDPNKMDATCVLQMSKWVVAELVRLFHSVDTETAETAIDAIVERELTNIWKVGDKQRVLDTSLNMKQKALLLLYSVAAPVEEEHLFDWVEHSNPSVFRRDVLRPLHKERKIEYDSSAKSVTLSPKGIADVEDSILRTSTA